MKNNKTVKKINKKLHKASKIINLAATALVLAMTVYTLIPKDEKSAALTKISLLKDLCRNRTHKHTRKFL